MHKKIIATLLSACMCIYAIPLNVFSEEYDSNRNNPQQEDVSDSLEVPSVVSVSPKTVNDIVDQSKFTAQQGHGFAAERGNTLVDQIKGKNTRVVGDNNIKNGPDRLIINRDGTTLYIQDKYYANAKSGINACFDNETGLFKYYQDSNPMQIEVPADQYEEAVAQMRIKIEEGKVPGITDPAEAETLVRKGTLTYKQAKNLAKAGTVESLSYDAANGVVSAGCAFGISTIINYASCRVTGVERDEALKIAVDEGLKSGVSAFGVSVIAGQVTKTGVVNVFKPSSEALVRALGRDFAKAIVESTGKQVSKYTTTKTLTSQAAKILRSNTVVAVITITVFTIPDAVDLFRGRISKEQFIKNFAIIAVSVVGGIAGGFGGAFVGNLIAPGVGTVPGEIVGTILGGTLSGLAADTLADYIVEDDAEEMYAILQDSFAQKCVDYIVNEEEAEHVAEALNAKLNDDLFKDMYQSKDRKTGEDHRQEFVDNLLDPLFEQEISKREVIEEPTEEEMRELLLEQLDGVVFVH